MHILFIISPPRMLAPASSLVRRVALRAAANAPAPAARRFYQFDAANGVGGLNFGSFGSNQTSAATWPRSMWNTVLCVCPPGEKLVVERIDGHVQVTEPGLHLLIPIIHTIRYRVDMREMAIEIPPQTTITKDNVSVDVSGCIYVQVGGPGRLCLSHAAVLHRQSPARLCLFLVLPLSAHHSHHFWGFAVQRRQEGGIRQHESTLRHNPVCAIVDAERNREDGAR